MASSFVTLAIFIAVVLFIGGVYSVLNDVFFRDSSRLNERIKDEFRSKTREKAKKTELFKNLGKLASESQQTEPGVKERFITMIEQSGMDNMTPAKLLTMSCIGMVILAIIGWPIYRYLGVLVGAGTGFYLPIFFVNFKRKSRLDRMRGQLPEVFDLMGRVIRAGQTMTQAMQAVMDESPAPVNLEFALCYEQMNLGIPPEAALRDLARRTGIMELQIFVMALLIQRQTGGNLAELLDGIAAVVRQRFKILGQIRTLTAEGRMQATVLLVLPPGMLVMMLILNRDYAGELLKRPSLILAMLTFELLGALWIRKIVNFDF